MARFGKIVSRLAMAAALVAAYGSSAAQAADKVPAAKSADVAWTFVVLDVGQQQGIFAKYGIDVDISALGGDAKVQQALAAKSVDFGLGSGPSMAFVAKGAPVYRRCRLRRRAAEYRRRGWGQFADQDRRRSQRQNACRHDRRLADRLARPSHRRCRKAGAPTACKTVALGGFIPALAALKTGQIDGIMAAIEAGYGLEERGEGKVLDRHGEIRAEIHHPCDLCAQRPDRRAIPIW